MFVFGMTPLGYPAKAYNGPYKVLKRTDKHFILDINSRRDDTVFLDRLKPAHSEHPLPDHNVSPEPMDTRVASGAERLLDMLCIWIAVQGSSPVSVLFTPHAQREWGKVIGHGVHIYIYLWSKKKFESYFRDRITFSNVDSRTSRRIYRLALLLRAPETLSSLSKSRISIFSAHLALLVRKMTSHNSIGKYRHLVN